MNEFRGEREWKDEFYFLKKTGLEPLYSTLLGMAQSKSDFRRFNNLLDPRVKLMRSHLIKLEDFWGKYVTAERKTIVKKQPGLNDETLRWLFTTVCDGNNSTKLYFDYLIRVRSDWTPPKQFPYARRLLVSAIKDYEFYGGCSFYINIFNSVFEVECIMSENEAYILVCLVVCEKNLTEELTYNLAKMPGYDIYNSQYMSHKRGNYFCLTYRVPFVDLNSSLLMCYKKFENIFYVFNDQFISNLKNKLVEMGLPISSLSTNSSEVL